MAVKHRCKSFGAADLKGLDWTDCTHPGSAVGNWCARMEEKYPTFQITNVSTMSFNSTNNNLLLIFYAFEE